MALRRPRPADDAVILQVGGRPTAAAGQQQQRPQTAAPRRPFATSAIHSLSKKLATLTDKSTVLRFHQGRRSDGRPVDHPLCLTQLSGREIIDHHAAGELAFEYDGAGSYYCRNCMRLYYGVSRHCTLCTRPPFDVCPRCFDTIRDRERTEDEVKHTGGGLNRAAIILSGGEPDAEGGQDEDDGQEATIRECLADASRGHFRRLLKLLYPKPRSGGEDLAAEAAAGRRRFDWSAVDRRTGRTLLHYAAEAGESKVVFGLLMRYKKEGRGDLDSRDRQGMTPLMLGSMRGRTKVVEELIYTDADMEVMCMKRYNALMLAACYGHADCVSRLLHGGAEVNCRTTQGRTPLALAALNGHHITVRTLLRFPGCDPNIADDEGYTAVLLAAARGHHEAFDLFPDSCKKNFNW
eukprot:TRINITY_DN260_c0_g1_i2.p1 TRINITY_DN260_c0_g1~~TRINITY_DN260_c0_g1_i2.p1  ORF type:complete len:431 (+),score=144.67 TRINITY_DN260_c0_g1_i2:75-1295(+)